MNEKEGKSRDVLYGHMVKRTEEDSESPDTSLLSLFTDGIHRLSVNM